MLSQTLILDYENLLLGNLNSLALQKNYSEKQAEKHAKDILRFAVERILKWSPEEFSKKVDSDVIEKMKLQEVLAIIPFPPELDKKKDLYYLAYYLYPRQIAFNFRQSVIFTYRKLMANKLLELQEWKKNPVGPEPLSNPDEAKLRAQLLNDSSYQKIIDNGQVLSKFPKEYMSDLQGRERAGICLQYVLNEFFVFHSKQEMYQTFADENKIIKELKIYGLYSLCKDLYNSPLEYLHDSLSESQQDELLYSYYQFENWSKELNKKQGEVFIFSHKNPLETTIG